MQDFFKSRRFKIFVGIFAVLIGFMIYAASTSEGNAVTNAVNTFMEPLRKVSSSISEKTSNFFDRFLNADEYIEENEALKEELAELRKQMAQYSELEEQNKSLREAYDLKEQNPDFVFEEAAIVAKDPLDQFHSFTIDKGSNEGIDINDPVITGHGLVGKVVEIGPGYAKVMTIYNPQLYVSAIDKETNKMGSINGSIDHAANGFTKFIDLELRTDVKIGNVIYTAGSSGIFPKNLIVGTVEEVAAEANGKSDYALVKPAVDIESITRVLIIKEFEGQGTTLESIEANGE